MAALTKFQRKAEAIALRQRELIAQGLPQLVCAYGTSRKGVRREESVQATSVRISDARAREQRLASVRP